MSTFKQGPGQSFKVPKNKIQYIKDLKSPSVSGKDSSGLKSGQGKDKNLTSTASVTGVNSTNANSMIYDTEITNAHGSAKS